jgi:hypothetical protein
MKHVFTRDRWSRIVETINTYSTVIYCASVLCIGSLLMWYATDKDWWDSRHFLWISGPALQSLIHNVGSLLVASVPISLFWELITKRRFLDEILAKARIAKELEDAGFVAVYESFQQITFWGDLFAQSQKLDIFFFSGHSWRSNCHDYIREFLSRPYARLRVIVPDPEDDGIVNELARQFRYTPERVRDGIQDAIHDFVSLAPEGRKVEIYCFNGMSPHLSFYRFDNTTVYALYNHDSERSSVPAFVVRREGFLYRYLRHEFDVIQKNSRQVFPVPVPQESKVP